MRSKSRDRGHQCCTLSSVVWRRVGESTASHSARRNTAIGDCCRCRSRLSSTRTPIPPASRRTHCPYERHRPVRIREVRILSDTASQGQVTRQTRIHPLPRKQSSKPRIRLPLLVQPPSHLMLMLRSKPNGMQGMSLREFLELVVGLHNARFRTAHIATRYKPLGGCQRTRTTLAPNTKDAIS